MGESQFFEIQPHQIGRFVTVGSDLRDVFSQKFLAVLNVIRQIAAELVEPLGAVGVGRFQGHIPENIAVNVDGVVHEVLELRPQFRVGDDDFGGEQAREVEGLARRHARDGVLGDFL